MANLRTTKSDRDAYLNGPGPPGRVFFEAMCEDIATLEAEVSRIKQRQASDEEQLVRIADHLGKDARHSSDGTIAGLVISALDKANSQLTEIYEACGCDNDLAVPHIVRAIVKREAELQQENAKLRELVRDCPFQIRHVVVRSEMDWLKRRDDLLNPNSRDAAT